jgi:hypothetical protein
MSFLTVRPYVKSGNTPEAVKLRVTDSIEVTKEFTKTPVKLFNTKADKGSILHYLDAEAGYTFQATVVCLKTDMWHSNKSVLYWLNYYYEMDSPLSIVIDTEIVPNGLYVISDFTKRETLRKDYWEFEMKFTTYRPSKAKIKNKVTVLQSYLKQCKMPKLKLPNQFIFRGYRKNETVKVTVHDGSSGQCIYYMNKVLYKKGFLKKKYVTIRYRQECKQALINFQKKWNKKKLKPKLNTKGKMDKNTWKAIQNYVKL